MKRLIALLMILVLCSSVSLADTLSIDLTTATDDELTNAIQLIQKEQKSRIKTSLTLDQTDLTLAKGKQGTINATLSDLPEGETAPKLTWLSSDENVATVKDGKIKAVADGSATITCSAPLAEGIELSAQCQLTVITPATGLSIKKNNLTLQHNEAVQMEVTIAPKTATVQTLTYETSDASIATVSSSGLITGVGAGQCKITAKTTDGSNKSVSCTVKISSFEGLPESFTVTSKTGDSFTGKYYGKKDDLQISCNSSAYADVDYSLLGPWLSLSIDPIKTGTFTVTISDKSNSFSKVQIKVTIDAQATYNTQSYPLLDYDSASRYPDLYTGDQVSFKGNVLQVMKDDDSVIYRISSRGNYNDVVMVYQKKADITVPLIEDDKVTVYGSLAGCYTYTAVLGNEITIPLVMAERINIR